MIKSLNIDFEVSGTKISIPFKSICSIVNEPFNGNVIIEYHPKRKVVEYVDLEKFINKTTKDKLTAESLANTVYKAVYKSILPKFLKVTVDVAQSKAHQPVQVWIISKIKYE